MHYGRGEYAKPVTPVEMKVGDKVKLTGDDRWWDVKAVSEHFVACTRQAPFQPKGTLVYTVLDWRNGVRGPCDLIGQGWGDGTYTEQECSEMLEGFEYDYRQDPDYIEAQRAYDAGEADTVSWPSKLHLQVSQRTWVRLGISAVRKK